MLTANDEGRQKLQALIDNIEELISARLKRMNDKSGKTKILRAFQLMRPPRQIGIEKANAPYLDDEEVIENLKNQIASYKEKC